MARAALMTRRNTLLTWYWLIEHGFTSPRTVMVIWGTVLQVKRPNQQYRSTEGKNTTKVKKHPEKANNTKYSKTIKRHTYKKHSKSPSLHNSTMGWLGDGSHRGQVRQAWTAVGLPPRYPRSRDSCLWTQYLCQTRDVTVSIIVVIVPLHRRLL